jgi:endonuclease/exonuclease/phosphatase family metal-dependent hydrolase
MLCGWKACFRNGLGAFAGVASGVASFSICHTHSSCSGNSSDATLYRRQWVPHSSNQSGDIRPDVRFSVAQFNILADGLSAMRDDLGGFTASPVAFLDWDYRKHRIVEELMRHGSTPDIIALQEVDHFYDWFEPVLNKHGYEGLFFKKPNSPCRSSRDPSLEDGCALFWKNESMKLVSFETMNYDRFDLHGKPLNEKSNQVALIAVVEPLGGIPMAVATTHLLAAKTPEGERTRSQQINQLLGRLQQLNLPCIIALDMNAALQEFFSALHALEAYNEVMQNSLKFESAYIKALGAELRDSC